MPFPVVESRPATVQSVHVELEEQDGELRATVVRFAAERVLRGRPLDGDAHLVVRTGGETRQVGVTAG